MFALTRKRPFIRMAALSTLIADDVEIEGDLVFSGGLRIDGRLRGNVRGRAGDAAAPTLLILAAKGRIEGSVRSGDAVINGTVVGDLDIDHRLELQSDARVIGTIRYRQLQMDVGATVQGQLVRVEAEPAADNVVALGAEKAGAAADRR